MKKRKCYWEKAMAAVSSAVIAATALTCVTLNSSAADAAITGDLSGNGFLDAADLSLMKQGILEQKKDAAFKQTGDVNQSGAINAKDTAMLREYLLGKITAFEKGEPDGEPSGEIPTFEKSYNFPAVSSLKASNEV
ncbi:MAG: dockerin type I repeat-containing protein, partial [Oscillospiraceae bacterium]|nr:dockerin type I repeat-containing protein [Oscillospiraceae bacterium]